MTDPAPQDAPATVRRLQRAMLALAAATTVGTAVELAMLRHWNGFEQLIPWFTLAVVASAVIASAALPYARASISLARIVGVAAGAAGLFGAYEHIRGNMTSGPLDYRYTDRWATMSLASRWWTAASGGVGPSPALAPAILGLAGVCLALSTVGKVPANEGR